MLKTTDVRLEKFVDIDMYLFIQKGLRGGISSIAKSYFLHILNQVTNTWKVITLKNGQNL